MGSWPRSGERQRDSTRPATPSSPSTRALLDSDRNIIVCEDDHLLAVLGMDDCIIVHTHDATLVCNKSDSQRLKESSP